MRLLYGIVENAKAFASGTRTPISIKEVGKLTKDQKKLDAEKELLTHLKDIAEKGIYVGIPEKYNGREEEGRI